jgi:uncharacterized membrane protein
MSSNRVVSKVVLAVSLLALVFALVAVYVLSSFATQEVPRPPGFGIPIEIVAVIATSSVVSVCCVIFLNRNRRH